MMVLGREWVGKASADQALIRGRKYDIIFGYNRLLRHTRIIPSYVLLFSCGILTFIFLSS